MFSDKPIVISMGCDYVYIVMIFSFGVFIQIVLEKTLQATGNMIYPMFFQLTGAITNIILDPILIFGLYGVPELGVKGAAIATVIGQIFALIFSIIVVVTKKHSVKISLKGFRFNGRTIKEIYTVGLPSIIMQSIGSLLVGSLNAILATFSEAQYRYWAFITSFSLSCLCRCSLTQGVMPIMGYNFEQEIKETVGPKFGCIIASIIMAIGTAVLCCSLKIFLMIFNASDELIEIGIPASV